MFVLDLPISIGVEYGWDALWKFGGLYKNEIEISQQDAGTTNAGFTTYEELSTSGTYYSTDLPDPLMLIRLLLALQVKTEVLDQVH